MLNELLKSGRYLTGIEQSWPFPQIADIELGDTQ